VTAVAQDFHQVANVEFNVRIVEAPQQLDRG
jgi:hypothetical protein